MGEPERLKICLLLPSRRRRDWHDRFASRLAAHHDVIGGPSGADLTIDLTEKAVPGGGRILRPLYDGSPDTRALLGRLQRGECPLLDIVDGDDILASSYAAIGDSGTLDGRLAIALARVEALLLRALAAPNVPLAARPVRKPAAFSLPLQLKSAARRLAGRLLAPLRSPIRRQWNLALEWDDRPVDFRSFDLGAYTPLPVDPEVFYADPFVMERAGRHYLFAEAYPYAAGKGTIVCAEVAEGAAPGPFRVVLERPWHLSYPYVFAHGGELYLMPEASTQGGVEVYRAARFPDEWVPARKLLEDHPLVDATLFEHEGRLWLLAGMATPGGSDWDELFAWHAPTLEGPWAPHALNPIKSDCRSARPGGRPLRTGGRLFRPAQRCERAYGEALVWMEIRTLTPDAFEEVEIAEWRAAGPDLSGPHSADLSTEVRAIDFRSLLNTA